MSMMRRVGCIAAVLLLTCSLALGQEALVTQIESALASRQSGVYDLGHLLKPGGVRELQQKLAQLQGSGGRIYIMTIPRDSTNVQALAETVYRDLNMGPDEVLILFDGRRVYGKSLALKGNPQAFQEAFREAQPGFRLYYAKGLAQFAQAIVDRINQRQQGQTAEEQAAARRTNILWAVGLLVAFLIGAAVAFPRVKQRVAVRQAYDARLHSAEQVFDRITINMPGKPSETVNAEWVRLDEELRRLRERHGTTPADVEKLNAEVEAFDRRLKQAPGPESQS
jgi:uncharacterized membrane protein YgcG